MKNIILLLITFYRKSRILSYFSAGRCRFQPSCSEYAYEAISRYGASRGCLMAAKRLLKCHPFHEGGYDPVN